MAEKDRIWATGVAERIVEKERAVAKRNRGRIPYSTKEEHRFNDQCGDGISWWTNGFWGGMQWQLWNRTQEEIFRENALFTEKQLDAVLMNYQGMDHDSGFRWLPTAVAAYRLFGSAASRNRGLLAAANLAGRFNGNGNFIRAWNDWGDGRDTTGWAIIDCMMNLPLLYWASEELGDPRFRYLAMRHANTAAEHFIREDGSVRHIVEFDPETGAYVREHGGQGMGEGSSWTRGQSWALYGFTLSYLHGREKHYLETACKVADAFVRRIPDSGLIPVDFDQPGEILWQDGTAASIAACGLLTLSKVLGETADERAEGYRTAAVKLLRALDEAGCDYDPDHDELLTRCSAAYHDSRHDFPIIYGDYYYIEAIWKLTGDEIFLW